MKLSRLVVLVAAAIVGVVGAAQGQTPVWRLLPAGGPSPRQNHAMAYDSARGVVVLFGGAAGATYNGETWEWNGSAWTQRVVSGPTARGLHAMAYDSARGVCVLFGGYGGALPYKSDTWEWNGTAWTQRAVSGPSGRFEHAMAYDSARGVTVLFGGYTGSENGETWEWNGTAWTQRVVSGPSARNTAAMAFDAARGVTVLFGGMSGAVLNAETWEWNGTAWAQRPVGGPGVRHAHAMAYDAGRGVTVLFGGTNNSVYNNETWEWNGAGAGSWTSRLLAGPPGTRGYHAMAYDAARGVTVLFGGFGTPTLYGDTWVLGASPAITQQPIGQGARVGDPVSYSVVAAGSAPTYQWRRNGVNLTNGGAVSGAASPTLTINPTGAGDAGAAYDCDVSNAFGSIRSNPAGLSLIPTCGSADFNGDGDLGTDADIEAFFRVLAGGNC
jgi:Immunoglobulin I-set domain